MAFLISLLWPLLAGGGMYVMSNQCKGKNAKAFFRYGAWGFWLIYLMYIPGPFMLPFSILNPIIKMAPAVVCFWMAISSIIKEMRAQAQGQYTDAA
jgi:hypothetical protein